MIARKTCVVFGATGFIGTAITRELIARGHDVMAYGSEACDLSDKSFVIPSLRGKLAGSCVIFAAGIPRQSADDMDAFQANVNMVSNLAEACASERPARVIYLSSVEVYGNTDVELPITESTCFRPERLYAVSKITGELLWEYWRNATAGELSIIRLPGVFGPGDEGKGFIGMLVKAIENGRSVSLSNLGRDLRDYVFVEDVARAVADLITDNNDSRLVVNLASGESRSIAEIAGMVCEELGYCRIVLDESGGSNNDLVFDTRQLQAALPGFAFTPLQDAVKQYPGV